MTAPKSDRDPAIRRAVLRPDPKVAPAVVEKIERNIADRNLGETAVVLCLDGCAAESTPKV